MSQQQSPTPDVSTEEILDEFHHELELQGLTDRTIETYESSLGIFIDSFGRDPRQIRRRALKAHLHYLKNERVGRDGTRGLSENALKNHFSAINSFYKSLKFDLYGDYAPCIRHSVSDNC